CFDSSCKLRILQTSGIQKGAIFLNRWPSWCGYHSNLLLIQAIFFKDTPRTLNACIFKSPYYSI
ncbi:MAG: hypothetical protein LUQ48_02240, partial [Methylococcaceae bacterium]|nr:hypothetical protein [Methylococcaceae bacterium]